MALRLKNNRSRQGFKFAGIVFAVFALFAQPLYGLVAGEVANALEVNGDTAKIYNAVDLADAASNPAVKNFSIKASFTTSNKTELNRNVNVDGNGNTITFAGTSAWHSEYVFQVYMTSASFKNIAITGGDAAIYANGSTVTLQGTVNVTGNEFGGIEVSQGSGVSLPAVLNAAGANVVNSTEASTKPTAWIDDASTANATVNGSFTETTHIGGDQKQYYLNAVNTGIVAVNTNTGKTFSTIQSAVGDIATVDGHTIVVSPGVYSENVAVSKSLTIKGAQAGNDARTRVTSNESTVNGTFTVTAPNATIDGFTFGSNDVAVNFNAAGTKILNNIVTNSNVNGSFQTDHLSTITNDVEISQNKFLGSGQNIRFLGNKDDSSKANNVVIKDNTSDGAVSFLTINNTKNSIVTGNVVNAATGSAVAIQGGNDNLTIERNTFESSVRTIFVTNQYITSGIMYPKNSDIHIHLNNLIGGPTGVTFVQGQTFKSDNQHVLDMTKNYWGSANGPYDQSNDVSIPNVNPGQTDTNIGKVMQKINYSSWLCQPFADDMRTAVNNSCDNTAPTVDNIVVHFGNGYTGFNPTSVTATGFDAGLDASGVAKMYADVYFDNGSGPVKVGPANHHFEQGADNLNYRLRSGIEMAHVFNRDGTYYLDVWSEDKADNQSAHKQSASFVIDQTLPTTSITSATQSGNSLSFDGTVSDANLRYHYCYLTTNQTVVVDGHTFTPGQEVRLNNNADGSRNTDCVTKWANGQTNLSGTLGGFNITGVPSGDYTVNLVAYDLAGNNNAGTPEQFVVSIDHTPPVLTINPVADSTDTTPTITGTTTDKDSPVFVDGQPATIDAANPNTDGTFNWSITLTAMSTGEHTVSASSQDAAGNTAIPATDTFVVETTIVNRGPTLEVARSLALTPVDLTANTFNTQVFAQTDNQPEAETQANQRVLGTSDTKGQKEGSVLAATDEKVDGCTKFFGICWYWWIPVVVAAIVAIYLLARRRTKHTA